MLSRWIDANKAYFSGDRAEARRLLEEFRTQSPAQYEQGQWLYAHAQEEYEAFIDALYELIDRGDPDNHYVQMARDYLGEEHQMRSELAPPPRNRSRLILAGGVIGVILLLVFGLPVLLNQQATEPIMPTPTDFAEVIANPTGTPVDRSQTLFGDVYTARFNSGILQITAVEDRSERVINLRDETLASAVPGARFIALSVVFECRSGICRQPPQADLFLQLDNDELAPVRTDVYIDNRAGLEPVALGRTTTGWIIFEVPALNRPISLIIRPFADELGTRPPDLVIELPIF